MSVMGWVLAAAVLAALGRIVAVALAPLFRADRRDRLAAEADALQDDVDRLEAMRDGGDPERPIVVASASQIEPRAEREPCPACTGRFHVLTHTVRSEGDQRLREVICRCGGCGFERTTWFRVHGPTLAQA